MKLCRFEVDGAARNGKVEGESVVDSSSGESHPLDEVRLLAPVIPRKFLGIGLNYADHIAESGMEAPEFPVFFNKQSTCVVGPGDEVHMHMRMGVRMQPADVVQPRRALAGGIQQVGVAHHAHRHRAGVPAADRQAKIGRASCRERVSSPV